MRQNLLRRNNPTPLKIQLYNLDKDIGEEKNVAEEHPEIARRMTTIIAELE